MCEYAIALPRGTCFGCSVYKVYIEIEFSREMEFSLKNAYVLTREIFREIKTFI